MPGAPANTPPSMSQAPEPPGPPATPMSERIRCLQASEDSDPMPAETAEDMQVKPDRSVVDGLVQAMLDQRAEARAAVHRATQGDLGGVLLDE